MPADDDGRGHSVRAVRLVSGLELLAQTAGPQSKQVPVDPIDGGYGTRHARCRKVDGIVRVK